MQYTWLYSKTTETAATTEGFCWDFYKKFIKIVLTSSILGG
jgi:hypothetical protein